jgi:NAD(P)-dependent dehydrogenase (short-subunit alcohol dehydrogenase family)
MTRLNEEQGARIMADQGSVVIIGGTRGLGLEIVRHYAGLGREVWLSGQDRSGAEAVARGVGPRVHGLGVDLAAPTDIAAGLADVGPVGALVLAAIDRDQNSVADYDIGLAIRLATLKLVGYTEVVHALRPRLAPDAAVLLFGGVAKDRPYPGSTTVSTVNGGVIGLTRSLVVELKPIRVNSIHPGIVGNSPYWEGKQAALDATLARTPTGRLVAMDDIVNAVAFLLDNPSVNGVDLIVDGGITCV